MASLATARNPHARHGRQGASVIAGLYEAIASTAHSAGEYERWLQAAEYLAGPLERKRAADRGALERRHGIEIADGSIGPLLLAIETYLAVRALTYAYQAATEIRRLGPDEAYDSLYSEPDGLLSGRLLRELGVTGLDVDPAFQWVVSHASGTTRDNLVAELRRPFFETSTADVVDELRFLYHDLVPNELRHTIGAYFTPQWLAQYVLQSITSQSELPEQRLLDPTCGSGTFILEALAILRSAVGSKSITPDTATRHALKNIVGYEINPLTALFAKANYLRALAPLFGVSHPAPETLRVPIYVRDAVLPEHSQPVVAERLDETARSSYDVVVGNPPWVNWEHLPPDYRTMIQPLWPALGLFDLKGRDLAFSKEDISVLVTYTAADSFLRDGGKLTFLLPQSVVKSPLNSRGFRRFRIGSNGPPLRVLGVEDLSELNVFSGSAGRVSLFSLEKGQETTYPVPYRRWKPITSRKSLPEDGELPAILRLVARDEQVADLVDGSVANSPWMTARPAALDVLHKLSGSMPYKGRTGLFTGGANGVFHIEVVEALDQDHVLVRNHTHRAKRPVPQVEAAIENTFVFPLLRGREVSPWKVNGEICTILPHTAETGMHPVIPEEMAVTAPQTLDYLSRFRDILAERRGFGTWERQFLESGFYACQRIGAYTFLPYKVIWRYIAPRFIAAVVGPRAVMGSLRPTIPNEKLMQVAFSDAVEAHYFCGVLMSTPGRFFIESRMVGTQISPSVISNLAAPVFEQTNATHQTIAEASMALHKRDGSDGQQLAELDSSVASLFGLTAAELESSRLSLSHR
jgi:N-6 DNA Methylase